MAHSEFLADVDAFVSSNKSEDASRMARLTALSFCMRSLAKSRARFGTVLGFDGTAPDLGISLTISCPDIPFPFVVVLKSQELEHPGKFTLSCDEKVHTAGLQTLIELMAIRMWECHEVEKIIMSASHLLLTEKFERKQSEIPERLRETSVSVGRGSYTIANNEDADTNLIFRNLQIAFDIAFGFGEKRFKCSWTFSSDETLDFLIEEADGDGRFNFQVEVVENKDGAPRLSIIAENASILSKNLRTVLGRMMFTPLEPAMFPEYMRAIRTLLVTEFHEVRNQVHLDRLKMRLNIGE